MAYRFFNDKVVSVADGVDLVTAANRDAIIFSRDAQYAAMGHLSHVLAIGKGVSATIEGELYSGDGPTIYGKLASSTYNDFIIGWSGLVSSAASAAFSIAGQAMTLKNGGEISGAAAGVLSTAISASITNYGTIAGGTGISLNGAIAVIENHGQIAGSLFGITISGIQGGQQITNAGLIDGGFGTAINVRADGDILITNDGTITGRIGINLDVLNPLDTGERTIVNTGTITATDYAVYGSAGADLLDNQGHITGRVNLYNGDDLYDGHAGTVSGLVTGDGGDDVIIGSLTNRNVLGGGDGDDVLTGGGGNDVLVGGAGADVLTGGDGFDMVSYRDSSVAITASLDNGSNSDGDTYSSIESIQGSAFNDYLTGASGSRLFGGDGNDILDGGGDGRLVGGNGDDIYYPGSDRIVETEGGGTDLVYIYGGGYTLAANVENLTALAGDPSEFITLTGNTLANTIIGATAKDVIDGREGHDTLTGASGADTFNFSTVLSADNVDTITDFNSVDDTIRFVRSVIGLQSGGSPSTLGSNAFYVGPSAHDADDRVIYDPNTGNLYADFDGIGGAAQIQVAHLNGNPTVSYTDFILYG